jgi:hypothetical protein
MSLLPELSTRVGGFCYKHGAPDGAFLKRHSTGGSEEPKLTSQTKASENTPSGAESEWLEFFKICG